jgi:hypothetical protein
MDVCVCVNVNVNVNVNVYMGACKDVWVGA